MTRKIFRSDDVSGSTRSLFLEDSVLDTASLFLATGAGGAVRYGVHLKPSTVRDLREALKPYASDPVGYTIGSRVFVTGDHSGEYDDGLGMGPHEIPVGSEVAIVVDDFSLDGSYGVRHPETGEIRYVLAMDLDVEAPVDPLAPGVRARVSSHGEPVRMATRVKVVEGSFSAGTVLVEDDGSNFSTFRFEGVERVKREALRPIAEVDLDRYTDQGYLTPEEPEVEVEVTTPKPIEEGDRVEVVGFAQGYATGWNGLGVCEGVASTSAWDGSTISTTILVKRDGDRFADGFPRGTTGGFRSEYVQPAFEVGERVRVTADGDAGDEREDPKKPLSLFLADAIGVEGEVIEVDVQGAASDYAGVIYRVRLDGTGWGRTLYMRGVQIERVVVEEPEPEIGEALAEWEKELLGIAEDDEKPALAVGDRVKVVRSRYSGEALQPGATGTIDKVDRVAGYVGVMLDEPGDRGRTCGGAGWAFDPDDVEKIEEVEIEADDDPAEIFPVGSILKVIDGNGHAADEGDLVRVSEVLPAYHPGDRALVEYVIVKGADTGRESGGFEQRFEAAPDACRLCGAKCSFGDPVPFLG